MLEQQWRVFARYLSLSNRPILIGPWRSEVGFEILYWIPFLHKFMQDYKIQPDRLIAVGRGGSAAWYGFAGSADLYEHVPVEVSRTWSIQASQQTGSMKPHREEPWERHVCGLTAHALGLARYHRLSPSWMYSLLRPYWEGRTSQRWITERTLQPVKMLAPKLTPALQSKLPKEFIAMRWYARPTWPYQEKLNLWTREFTEKIAQKMPVVMIDSFHADDHADIHTGKIENVFRLSDLTEMTALDNLAIQSSVIAKAKAYVGTYGGMSQAAMRWGVPTLALYAEFGQTAPEHLSLTQHLSLRTGVPFIACQPKDVDGALPLILGRS
jgi:hypothetical protein